MQLLVILFSLTQSFALEQFYTQSHSFIISEKELESIVIQVTGMDAKNTTVHESPDVSTKLEIDVAGVEKFESDVRNFSIDVDVSSNRDALVKWRPSSYKCLYVFNHGKLSKLKGFCVTAARLYLPKNSTLYVTVDKKAFYGSIPTVTKLIAAIESETFSSDKEKVLKDFTKAKRNSKSDRYITTAQVIQIIQLFSVFDGEEVAKQFSGYVTDPENVTAEAIKDHVSTFDVEKVVALLKK